MANCVKTFYGAWVGPGPSYFRVVAEVWDCGDSGSGHNLRLRRWVQVNDVGNFNGTVLATSWAGSINLYGPGAYYGLSETGNYHIEYGARFYFGSENAAANYTGRAYYDSRTTVSYTVPIPTYKISYDANGGTGAPGVQTKTHGKNLTLSNTKPTRSGHEFLGWSTSKTATTPDYLAEGTYTRNASTTLYAVWKRKGRLYLVQDGKVKKGRAYLYTSGKKHVGIPWMKVNGVWRKGGA